MGRPLQVVDPEHVDSVVGHAAGVAPDEYAPVGHHLLAVDVDRRLAAARAGPGRPSVCVGLGRNARQLVDQLRHVGVQRLDLAGPRRDVVRAAEAVAAGARAVVGVRAPHRDVARRRPDSVGDRAAYLRRQQLVEADQVAVDDDDLVVVVGQHQRGRVQRHVDAGRGLDAPHDALQPEPDGRRDVYPRYPGCQRVLAHVGSPGVGRSCGRTRGGSTGPCTRRRSG